MLDEMDQVDERDVYANKLYTALLTARSQFDGDELPRVILYLVATLYLYPRSSSDGTEETILTAPVDRGAIPRALIELMEYCDVPDELAARLQSTSSLGLITRLKNQISRADLRVIQQPGFARRLFDIILRRIFESTHQINLLHPHIVAALAVSLCKRNDNLVETFPYSGALRITANVLKHPQESFFWSTFGYPYAHQDLVRLRLMVRGLDEDRFELARVHHDDQYLTLIDGAQHRVIGSPDTFTTLNTLIEKEALGDVTLLILNAEECRNIPPALRERIARDDLLEAVIDVPSFDSTGNRTINTAWLLNRNKDSNNRNETLFIDAAELVAHGNFEPIWFAAAIIERWRKPMGKVDRRRYKHVLDSKLKGLFLKYFEDKYTDLPGLCKEYSSDKAIEAQCLTASNHLEKESGHISVVSVDNRVLLERLRAEDDPSCSYIIGNNGAGKSLLLRGLVDELSLAKLDSVGIAFSPMDRFPVDSDAHPHFEYQGASNSLFSSDRTAFLNNLSAQLNEIYSDGPTLQTFTQVLEQINFSHRHYLCPQVDLDDDRDDWERRLAIIELQEDPEPLVLDDNYEPGLKRQERGPIVPFSVLSSGEQQILSLLIKVCAKAGPHTVFLIDEPETSLHVRWQQQLPSLLSLIAKEFRCSFVVATHAPIIVANARDALSDCYLAHKQTLTAILPHQRHSVEAILLDGFGTYTPDSNEISERCAVLVARAIRVVNQPGEIDTQQQKQLTTALTRMSLLLKASSAAPEDPGYKKDLRLIKDARAAINELFAKADA